MATHPTARLKPDNETFIKPMSAKLTQARIQARRKRRLTYDCMSAIVKGIVVVCKKGHRFPQVGRTHANGLSLLSVLRGRSSSVCQRCKDYDEETTE